MKETLIAFIFALVIGSIINGMQQSTDSGAQPGGPGGAQPTEQLQGNTADSPSQGSVPQPAPSDKQS